MLGFNRQGLLEMQFGQSILYAPEDIVGGHVPMR